MGERKPAGADATRTYRSTSASRPELAYALLVSSAKGAHVVQLGAGPSYVIGRAPSCDVPIADDSLSREHARLSFGHDVTICDLGSKNGTVLGGARLAANVPAPITVGTPFELGAVMLMLQRAVHASPAPDRAPAKRASAPSAPVLADPAMRHLYRLLDIVAPSPVSVLILGETGVGKEVYAEALHRRSSRAKGTFLPIHCAALPESMLEAELFGYEKGAFTGAAQRKPGLFEAADGGTVFLDEIGEIPLATQARLLRVLETGEVMSLGSVRPIKIDVRFVSATHRDLHALIGEQRFRANLYFRLNGMSITLPPLRSRRADIGPLARYFAERAAASMGKSARALSDDAVLALEAYAWPGNVRELKNVVERAVLLCDAKKVEPEHLALGDADSLAAASAPSVRAAPGASAGDDEDGLRERLRELEKKKIVNALAKLGGNQSQAAKELGISRFTLMHRMEEFGLARPRKRP